MIQRRSFSVANRWSRCNCSTGGASIAAGDNGTMSRAFGIAEPSNSPRRMAFQIRKRPHNGEHSNAEVGRLPPIAKASICATNRRTVTPGRVPVVVPGRFPHRLPMAVGLATTHLPQLRVDVFKTRNHAVAFTEVDAWPVATPSTQFHQAAAFTSPREPTAPCKAFPQRDASKRGDGAQIAHSNAAIVIARQRRWASHAMHRGPAIRAMVKMKNKTVLSMQVSPGEIRSMTGVRGIAALSVVALHYFDNVGASSRPWQHAYLAVDLFFMLSGLVLALNYSSTVTLDAGRDPYIAFIKKRIARIFPLYIVVTLIETALDIFRHTRGAALPDTWNLKGMIANLLLVQSWGFARSIVHPAWSLSTELAAYLLFPVLVLLTIKSRKAVALVVAATSVAILLAASVGSRNCAECTGLYDLHIGDTPYPLMRCLTGFMFGLFAWRLVSLPRIRAIASTDLFAVFAMTGTVYTFFAGYHDLVVYVFLLATVIACYGSSRAANVVFGNRVVHFLGTISFSIYLGHMLLFPSMVRLKKFAAPHLGALAGVFVAVVSYAGIIVLATAFHYLVEVPGKRFMLRMMVEKARPSASVQRIEVTGVPR